MCFLDGITNDTIIFQLIYLLAGLAHALMRKHTPLPRPLHFVSGKEGLQRSASDRLDMQRALLPYTF